MLAASPKPTPDEVIKSAFANTPTSAVGTVLFARVESSTRAEVQALQIATVSLESDAVAIKQVVEYHRTKAIKEQGTKRGWAKRSPTKPDEMPLYKEWQQVQRVDLPASPPKL